MPSCWLILICRWLGATGGFLAIAARKLAADYGIRQFLDFGSGLPGGDGSMHDVFESVSPDCHVVYVDNDAIAYSHASALLANGAGRKAAKADLSDPGAVLAEPAVRASGCATGMSAGQAAVIRTCRSASRPLPTPALSAPP
jgi:hypothetical protein